MCGFAALLCLDGRVADRHTVGSMISAIRHRGPDDWGDYFAGPLGFGFRRLSILDLSPSGHQPMSTADGRYTIVFNGEIYNYRELRAELETAGHRFRSSGDTEVLLTAYREWGSACLDKLNGMWAFLIHDKVRNLVFGSRDRFGIKPLYMRRDARQVLFASEIKALRASGLCPKEVNWAIAADFLVRTRLDQTRRSFFVGVEQLPAATAFELRLDGTYREWQYWNVDLGPGRDIGDPVRRFAELFEDAVRLQLRSDVPLGVHLSGGLDSTSIVCAAARTRNREDASQPIMAFSYFAPEYDETRYIADTLAQTGAHLIRLESDPERFWTNLKEVMWFQDEPFHSIYLLVAYELMRLTAANGIKVVLNGQGADETLAGYPTYFRDYWNSLMRAGTPVLAWREIASFARAHGSSTGALLLAQHKHLLQTCLGSIRSYRRAAAWNRRRQVMADDWFDGSLKEHVAVTDDEPSPADLDEALVDSVKRQPLPLYLRLEDRNSMAHSLEARVPFLDHRLVELEFSLPPNWRMRGPWNKYLLREAMRGRIPESVRSRLEKFGFPVPVRQWMSKALYEPARTLISAPAARQRGIYNTENILRDLERHRRGEIDVGAKIFNVLQFETWLALEEAPAAVREQPARHAERGRTVQQAG